VTLTHQTLDVKRIFQHLTEEMGFWEVGFAPVTTAPQRGYAIGDSGFDDLLTQFRALAHDYKQAALEHAHHGFSKAASVSGVHHVNEKTECQTCWARPICAGGCYHEANTRYGSTARPNLHYCEWIRGWTQNVPGDLRRDCGEKSRVSAPVR
jgi:uncharacterized protein